MEPSYLAVMILFLIAGLLVGGVVSAYQNGSKALTLTMAVVAAVAVVYAVVLLIQVAGE